MEFIRSFFLKLKGGLFPFFLNFAGFALAFAVIGLSFLFVKNEITYDNWIGDADHAYRAHWILSPPGHSAIAIAAVSPRFADILSENPNITRVTRLSREQITLVHEGVHYPETVQSADPNFLEAFGLSLQQGSDKDALASANAVVLTKRAADKYFPGKNPVGQVLETSEGTVLPVTGVLKDIPKNTHLDLYMIISSLGNATGFSRAIRDNGYGDTIAHTYFWINANVSPSMVLDEINQRLAAAPLMPPEQTEMLKPVADIMPVHAIHLHNLPSGELKPGGSPVMVAAFLIIGVLLIIILSVNFSILAVSQGQKRMREYGVKRAFGASVRRLVMEEFYGNLLILSASVILAILLVYPLIRLVEAYIGISLSADIITVVVLMLPAPFIMALIATCAMFFPANALFRKPVAALLSGKSNPINSLKNRIPVTLQFGMAGFLVIMTVIVTLQTNYAMNTSLKSVTKPVYIVDIDGSQASPGQIQTAIERIKTQKNVIAASQSLIVPTKPVGCQPVCCPQTGVCTG